MSETEKEKRVILINDEEKRMIRETYWEIKKEVDKIMKDKNLSTEIIDFTLYSYLKDQVEATIRELSEENKLTKREKRDLKNSIFKIISEEDRKRKNEST